MKKSSTKKNNQQKPPPTLQWQTGNFDRRATFTCTLPYQFLLLCKLMHITPANMVSDFMDNLSGEYVAGQGRDQASEHLVNYFIARAYGQEYFSGEHIRQIFKEMNALGLLFPADGKKKLLHSYDNWRKHHHRHWFKKWYRKPKRYSISKAE